MVGKRQMWKIPTKTRGEENITARQRKKADNTTKVAVHLDMQSSFKTVLTFPES